ncbi:MAG TPA: tetratricopeptide repeat protein [Stellaceae bacterium]|nr:tetratricopeptide repeat protein [Stellaceae bacterium]
MSLWRWASAERAYRRGYRHLRGDGVPHDPVAALHWLNRAARRGHARAQHALSMAYLSGVTGRAPCVPWLTEAQSRSLVAADNASLLYPGGLDVKPDPVLAFAWAKASARRGLACAEANLGMLLTRGIGCRQDFGEAALWYRRAAAKGDAAGALGLGILHEGALGVRKDVVEAMRWYRTAAEGGNDVAATALGLLLMGGTSPDLGEAQRRLSGPAARGFAHAQYGMGLLALRVDDKTRAKFWLSKASAQGHAGARAALAGLDTTRGAAA